MSSSPEGGAFGGCPREKSLGRRPGIAKATGVNHDTTSVKLNRAAAFTCELAEQTVFLLKEEVLRNAPESLDAAPRHGKAGPAARAAVRYRCNPRRFEGALQFLSARPFARGTTYA